MPPLYELRGLRRVFEGRTVLDIASLTIEEHEIYALLGPNGSGKTTLMRLLAFLDAPSEGKLFFRGREVPGNRMAQFRQGVVLVPQFPVMFTGSLLYNIEYPLALKKIPAARRRREALDLLEAVRLVNLAHAPARHLSGGEAQRASIARALAAGAQVLLFDEPTASVDHRAVADMVYLISDIWTTKHLSILITTHQSSLAADLCRRHIFLDDGRPVARQMLPDGMHAQPAQLVRCPGNESGTRLAVMLRQDSRPGGPPAATATVRGLHSMPAGTVLRLSLPDCSTEYILLKSDESRSMALSLRLGDTLDLINQEQSLP